MSLFAAIEKRFPSFSLNVRFEAKNEVLALLGASGCGKSVTLKCIAGILKPDRGRIALDGRVLFDSEKHIDLPPQKRRVGYLFQQYALFPTMTLRQNILCAIRDTEKKEKQRLADEWIERFHLRGLEDKRPSQLSGGEQQRTALARILASKPEAILLDEPFSALDSHLKWQLETELADTLSDFGGTAVWVSHDRDEIYRNCPRICVLHEGESEEVLPREALFSHPRILSAARLSGCKNCFPAAACGDRTLQVEGWPFTLCVEQCTKSATHIGIPAQKLRVADEGAQNAFFCRVTRAAADYERNIYMLKPEGAADNAPPIRMEVSKDTVYPVGARLRVCVSPRDIMPLCERSN